MASAWAKEDRRRNKRAVFQAQDLGAHLKYYEDNFGMKLVKQCKDTADFDIGQGFGHYGIVSQDVYDTAAKVKASGGKITREAGPVKGGQTVIAFAEDPSGYNWELIQRPPTVEPLCQK
eukprot:gene13843-19765_t